MKDYFKYLVSKNKSVSLRSSFVFGLALIIIFVFYSSPAKVIAQSNTARVPCGLNIDPANGGGYPSPETLAGIGVKWVRIEYKDCTTIFPPEESVAIFREVLNSYKRVGINTLVILDYLTYPMGAIYERPPGGNTPSNLELFGNRVGYIVQELDSLIDAYQIWNEPDHCAQYCVEPDHYARIVNELSQHLPTNKTVLGGFASGNINYYESANIPSDQYAYVGVHPYGKQVGGFWQDWPPGEMLDLVNAYKNVRQKPVWITEIGFSSPNASLAAEYLRRVYTMDVGAENIFWFAWSDAMVSPFGITDSNQLPKEGFREFARLCGGNLNQQITMSEFIDPPGGGSCGGSPGNRSINDYLTIPLILEPDKYGDSLEDALLESMILDHGYEVSCAAPEITLTPKALGLLLDYFRKNQDNPTGEGSLWLVGGSDFSVSLLDADIPLFRSGNRLSSLNKTDSYEGVFGNHLVGNNLTNNISLNSGVVNLILSTQEQCSLKLENLKSVKKICEMMENPAHCAFNRQIPGTEFNFYTPRDQAFTDKPSLLDRVNRHGLTCQQLTTGWENYLGLSHESFNEITSAISKVPIDLGILYRHAFLVITPKQDQDQHGLCHDTLPDREDVFWFLRKRDDVNNAARCEQYRNAPGLESPIVLAFKIPTFATNEIRSLPIHDSGSIAAKLLDSGNFLSEETSSLLNSIIEEEGGGINQGGETKYVTRELVRQARFNREDSLTKAQDAKLVSETGSNEEKSTLVINCSGMPACDGAHGSGTELTRVLTHIINGKQNSCLPPYDTSTPTDYTEILLGRDNPNPLDLFERASVIGSPANYEHNPQRAFLEEHYNVLLNSFSIGVENWYWGLEVDAEAAQRITDDGEHKYQEEQIKAHMVAPIGTDLAYLEMMLASFFLPEELRELISQNEIENTQIVGNIPRYLPVLRARFKYDAQAWTNQYRHAEYCECECEMVYQCSQYNSLGACVSWSESCVTPDSCSPDQLKIPCARGGVAMRDDFEENPQRVGFVVPGAKLGWFLRKIQLAISAPFSSAHKYFKTCRTTEDLLLGRCGNDDEYGPPDGLPWTGSYPREDWQSEERCKPITNSSPNAASPCNANNLREQLDAYIRATKGLSPTQPLPISEAELNKRAHQASIICNAESGGRPSAFNGGCETGTMVDYSVGLFQINLLAHSCHKFRFDFRSGSNHAFIQIPCAYPTAGLGLLCNSGYFNFTWEPPTCQIAGDIPTTTREINQCRDFLHNANNNIWAAFQLSGAGSSWWAWSTARENHCGICKRINGKVVCDGVQY